MKFQTRHFYVKTYDEMLRMFGDTPQVLTRTLDIAERWRGLSGVQRVRAMMSALGQYGEKIHKKVKNAVEIAAAEQQHLRLSKGLLHLAARMERPKGHWPHTESIGEPRATSTTCTPSWENSDSTATRGTTAKEAARG